MNLILYQRTSRVVAVRTIDLDRGTRRVEQMMLPYTFQTKKTHPMTHNQTHLL